jgi:hypothetical protein
MDRQQLENSIKDWAAKNKERREKVYSKSTFHERVYGLAFHDRIEYGKVGEIHKDLEDRVGIANAMTTTSALEQGWVRFSRRFGELEIHCMPVEKAARSILHLTENVLGQHHMLDLQRGEKHTYHEFDDAAELLEWVQTHI